MHRAATDCRAAIAARAANAMCRCRGARPRGALTGRRGLPRMISLFLNMEAIGRSDLSFLFFDLFKDGNKEVF